MSLKELYFREGAKICRTCMFIDDYACNIADKGKEPQGYDGTAICCKYDKAKSETSENRLWIAPSWEACSKYKKCTERQAKFLDVFDEKSQTIIPNPNDISKIND